MYDISAAPNLPGIYTLGHKQQKKPTKYRYAGRTENFQRRLREHKTGQRQAISKYVSSIFKQNKGSALRMKFVPEKHHRLKEGEYIRCLEEKAGYRLPLNKRKGDGLRSTGKNTTKRAPRRRTQCDRLTKRDWLTIIRALFQ